MRQANDSIEALQLPIAAAEADTVFVADLEAALAAPAIDRVEIVEEVAEPAPTWEDGLAGQRRETTIGDNSGVLALISGVFLAMMLSYKRCRRLFSTLWQELWGMRRRANVFDEHTSGETSALVLMAVQLSLCLGLLLYSAIFLGGAQTIEEFLGLPTSGMAAEPSSGVFARAIKLIGLMGGYYVAQLMAYSLVGYTFSDRAGQRLFVHGFTASQSLLGFTLIIPALVAIFYPTAAGLMVALGAGLYLIARIIFIIKGLRIFYTNFGGLFYFILYLCALEIIPVLIVYKLALILVKTPMI